MGRFPAFVATTSHSDSSPRLPRHSCVSCRGYRSRGREEVSQVPGVPQCKRAPIRGPGEAQQRVARVWPCWVLASDSATSSPLAEQTAFETHETAHSLPVYASRRRSPDAAQHSVPAGAYPLPGGVLNRWAPIEVSKVDSTFLHLPLPRGFAWRTALLVVPAGAPPTPSQDAAHRRMLAHPRFHGLIAHPNGVDVAGSAYCVLRPIVITSIGSS